MKELIEQMYSEEYDISLGAGVCRSNRFEAYVPRILEKVQGDILEIGAHSGKSTLIFLKAAKEYGRRVYVVDPWNGPQEGNEQVYRQFLKNTSEFKDYLHVLRKSSSSDAARKLISSLTLAFTFVDGFHEYHQVRNDLDISKHSEVICVDDVRGAYKFCERVMKAVEDPMEGLIHLKSPDEYQETYLIRDRTC